MTKKRDRKLPVKKRSLRTLAEKDAGRVEGGKKPPAQDSFRLTVTSATMV
jgi:hypothetical protein